MQNEEAKAKLESFILNSRLMSRKSSFVSLIAYIFENRDVTNFSIIETGTMRTKKEQDMPGDGGSTVLWGLFCKLTGNKCYTVDLLQEAIDTCRTWTKEYADVINYVTQDSVQFLRDFDGKIDLLYLDSFDSPPHLMEQASIHQLNEISACYDRLAEGTLILLDDAPLDLSGGKVKYSIPFLMEKGAKRIYFADTQILFQK